MKKVIYFVVIFCLSSKIVFSQTQIITVQHPTLDTAIFFTNIQQAIDSAWSGSSIYLPAITGDYSLPGFTVNKKLHIYGVGHYPDSTQATGRTAINGNIALGKGSDSGSISGLYINGNVSTDSINSYFLYRNRFINLDLNSKSKYLIFKDNVIIGIVNGANAENCNFDNNFFGNTAAYMGWGSNANVNVFNLKSCTFKNNIFFYGIGPNQNSIISRYEFYNLSYCLLENNIFLINDGNFNAGYLLANSAHNTFNNNIFETGNPIPNGSNIGQNNIVIENQDSIFVNQTGNVFNYSHNYKLRANNPGINAGTDGKDIGVYGGDEPYKEGAVPIIPHILKTVITPTTIKDGKLNIEMIIEAQTR